MDHRVKFTAVAKSVLSPIADRSNLNVALAGSPREQAFALNLCDSCLVSIEKGARKFSPAISHGRIVLDNRRDPLTRRTFLVHKWLRNEVA